MKIIFTYPSCEISIEIIFGANLIMHSINIKHFPHSVKVYSCNAHSIEKGSRGEIRELEPLPSVSVLHGALAFDGSQPHSMPTQHTPPSLHSFVSRIDANSEKNKARIAAR